MKVVILAGGFGTRISEESQYKPKPMVEIGGMPLLWHIMKTYSHYGFNEFIICAGYKQHIIKEWFANYFIHTSDITFDFNDGGKMIVHDRRQEPWKVTIIDTGLNTMTGGRVKRIKPYIDNERFFVTYGDGVSDVNFVKELEFHKSHGKMVTVSAYNAGQRFGVLDIDNDGNVRQFREKIQGDASPINIGYMICEPEFIDLIDGDDTVLEKTPMQKAAAMNEIMAYRHEGFWKCMDTVREKQQLEKLWSEGNAPWKTWEN